MAPTPVFLPGESHGQRSLAGCSPKRYKQLDTAEQLSAPAPEQLPCTGVVSRQGHGGQNLPADPGLETRSPHECVV